MNFKQKQLIRYILAAVMAAMIFVATYFLKIPITTPAGPTMIKVSNILCLLAGMLFGGIYGGLAAGIGSMIYDLLDPVYVTSSFFTFAFFFIMAFVCGTISNSGNSRGENFKRNLIGAVCGGASYWILYISKSIITLMLEGSAFSAAVVAVAPKMLTSGLNQVIAIVGSMLLIVPLNAALRKYLPKFSHKKEG